MGRGRREESALPATTERANEIRIGAAIEFGHYTMGLIFVTQAVSEKRGNKNLIIHKLRSEQKVRRRTLVQTLILKSLN